MTAPFVKGDRLTAGPQVGEVLEWIYGGWDHIRFPADFKAGGAVLQGCLPLLLEEISAEELTRRIGQKKYEQLRTLYLRGNLLNMWLAFELNTVLRAIGEAQIQVMVLKGADLAVWLYPRPQLRHFDDIDLLVRPEDLAATIAVLEGLGYSYHQEYRFEAISKQRAAFVYVKEGPIGHAVFEIHTSLHSNEMGVSFVPAPIWERARLITVAGITVYGMGLEDLLIYLCWHYRSHAFNRLIWLYDISMLLLGCADMLDWALVHRIAHERGLAATVYYCTLLGRQVFHVPLPDRAQVDSLRPPHFIQRLIARFVGDDLVHVLRRTAYRECKLLQRLAVDNVKSLFLIGLRAIVPSPTHLGRLYMQHSRIPVRLFWLYYPLHPLFVLRAYFRNRR